MPTSSPQRAIRERRIAVMLNEGQTLPAVAVPPTAPRAGSLALIAVIGVVCGLAVFLLLFHLDRTLPHARIRQPVYAAAAPGLSKPAAQPSVAAVKTEPFELHRSRRFVQVGSVAVRLLRVDSGKHSCLLVLRRNRKLSRVRLRPDQTEPITSLGNPHLQLRIRSVGKASVSGTFTEPR